MLGPFAWALSFQTEFLKEAVLNAWATSKRLHTFLGSQF